MWPFSCWKHGEGRKHTSPISLCAPPGRPAGSVTCPRQPETPLLMSPAGSPIPSLGPFHLLPARFFPSDVFSKALFFTRGPWILYPEGTVLWRPEGTCCPQKLLHRWGCAHHPALPFQENPVSVAPDSQNICLATLSVSLVMTVAFWPLECCSLSDCFHQGIQLISKSSSILPSKKSPNFLLAFFLNFMFF